MELSTLIGLLAGGLTTIAFVPQVVRVYRTRSTADISLSMYLIITTGFVLWLAYGFLIDSLPVILANIVTLVLAVTVLVFKVRYR